MCRYKKATKSQRNRRYPSVEAYDADRFLGIEKNTLQNVLLKQYRFPNEIRKGDHVAEFWSHTVPAETWHTALGLIQERTPLVSKFLVDDATDMSFLAMCQKLVGRDFKATGGIAVRFTSPVGRPVIRLTVVGIYNDIRTLHNNNNGPHVVQDLTTPPEERRLFMGLPSAWDSVTDTVKWKAQPNWAELAAV